MPTLAELFTFRAQKGPYRFADVEFDDFPIPVMKDVELEEERSRTPRFTLYWKQTRQTFSLLLNDKWQAQVLAFLGLAPAETEVSLEGETVKLDAYGEVTRESLYALEKLLNARHSKLIERRAKRQRAVDE